MSGEKYIQSNRAKYFPFALEAMFQCREFRSRQTVPVRGQP